MTQTTAHPSAELMELYCMNRTPKSAEASLEEHMLVCEDCRILTRELEEEIEMIRSSLMADCQA